MGIEKEEIIQLASDFGYEADYWDRFYEEGGESLEDIKISIEESLSICMVRRIERDNDLDEVFSRPLASTDPKPNQLYYVKTLRRLFNDTKFSHPLLGTEPIPVFVSDIEACSNVDRLEIVYETPRKAFSEDLVPAGGLIFPYDEEKDTYVGEIELYFEDFVKYSKNKNIGRDVTSNSMPKKFDGLLRFLRWYDEQKENSESKE